MPLLFIYQWLPEAMVRTICWTLIHSLWQGLLAAIIAGIIIISTRKTHPLLRYNLLTAVFLLFLASTVITFFKQLHLYNTIPVAVVEHVGITDRPVNNEVATGLLTIQQQDVIEQAISYFDTHAPLVVLIWMIFFMGQSIKLVAGLYHIYHIRNNKIYPPSPQWHEKMQQMADNLGIRKKVMLLESGLIKMPAIVGFFKPTILLPLGIITNLTPDQVETVLLHELAHIRRKDYLVNLLQHVSESIFFFNPGLRWVSSLMRQEREACCDDIVLLYAPNKKPYIEALVNFQEYALSTHTYAIPLGGHQNHLYNRVKRMLMQENKKLTVIEKFALLAGIIVITAFSFIKNKTNTQPPKTPSAKQIIHINNDTMANNHDTLPGGASRSNTINFRQINSYINNNDQGSVYEVDATDNKGNVYKVKKINGNIKEFILNNTPVAQEKLGEYVPVIDAIEDARAGHITHRRFMATPHSRSASIFNHRDSLNKSAWLLQRTNDDVFSGKRRKSIFEKKQPGRLFKPRQGTSKTNTYVEKIISDLTDIKLLEDPDSFSFVLNNDEMLVNGQPQAANIHDQFKKKYIKDPTDRISYSKANGTTHFDISIK
jgi:bla regulator protein BlaR1